MTVTPTAPGGRARVVAVVSDAIYPYHMGGKEIRYHHIVSGLVERGFEVHVFTMRWWDGPPDRFEDGVHYHALCRNFNMYRGSTRSIYQAVMFGLACLRLLRYRFDLIDADHMPHLQLFTIRAVALVRRVPLVVTWHEFWGFAYWRKYLGPLGMIAGVIELLAVRVSDQTITPSPVTRARLIDHGAVPGRVTVVPNGVDLPAIAASPRSPRAYDLLFVGRLIEHKHVDVLISAVGELGRVGIVVTCAIVGEGPEGDRLVAIAEREGCADRVEFMGGLDEQAEIFGLMKSANLLVLPSTREGYGIVVAEAIACGLRVVTTRHEDNQARLLVDEGVNGWLCDATTASLVAVLRSVLTAGAPSHDARDLERFGWDPAVAEVVSVHDRALAVRSRRRAR